MSAVGAWVAYCLLVAGLLALGAFVGEVALRAVQRPGRWPWLAALLLSPAIPAAAHYVPVSLQPSLEGIPVGQILRLDVLAVPASAAPPVSLTTLTLVLWLVISLSLLGFVLVAALRLQLEGRTWRPQSLYGTPVWLTRDLGPAVAGFGGRILLPEWALGLDRRLQRFMVLHEAEHVRAGDPRVLLLGLLVVVLMPWNPVLWWQLKRLRAAVELDCDQRVLRSDPDVHGYGRLLLEVGSRRSRTMLVVALSEPRAFLETRIRRILAGAGKRHAARGLVLAVTGVLLGSLAIFARNPLSGEAIASLDSPLPRLEDAAVVGEQAAPLPASEASQEPSTPVFTPFTVAPKLLNAEAVTAALKEAYPPLLRDAGIGGSPEIWFYLDATGKIRKLLLNKSSGYQQLDQAALNVAAVMRFSPAYNRDKLAPVWISLPITFTASGVPAVDVAPPPKDVGVETPRYHVAIPPPPAHNQTENGPVFTPFTVAPKLVNAEEVQRALQRNYPPLLRDAGVGGSPEIWFYISPAGKVLKTQLNKSSGYQQLDQAALAIAGLMRFSPALNRDTPVAVWVSLPITFSAK